MKIYSNFLFFVTPWTYSPPGSSVHGILQARIPEWVAMSSSRRSSQTQGSNPSLPHCRQILYPLSNQGSPRILEWVASPFPRGSSRPWNQTRVSCIAGGFFTSWATREARDSHMEQIWAVHHGTNPKYFDLQTKREQGCGGYPGDPSVLHQRAASIMEVLLHPTCFALMVFSTS